MPIGPSDLQTRLPNPLDPLWIVAFLLHAIIDSMNQLHNKVQAIRRTGGLFENFSRGLLAIRGKDGARFLHNVLTHDIKGLLPGQGCMACLLDRQGKIRFLCLVHARPEGLLLEMDPAHLSVARQELERYIVSEAIEFEEVTDRYRIISLHGPLIPELLTKAFPSFQLPSQPFQHVSGPANSGIHLILLWNLFGIPGFHLWIDPTQETPIRQQLLTAGQPIGLESVGQETFDLLRIESGIPWPGAEIDETVILNELNREELVSFTKGCFVGQEIVARIKYRAHPPRLLKGFLLQGTQTPEGRPSILLDSKPVGTITSCCFSPTLNRVIALGFLNFGVEVKEVLVQTAEGVVPATVTSLPFVTD